MRLLILDQDSQLGRATVELLEHHPLIDWLGVGADMLTGPPEALIQLIADYGPGFIINARSAHLSESADGLDKGHVRWIKGVCRSARENNAVFVHLSSAQVFNGARGSLFLEEDRPRPRGSVGRRMVELEQTVARQIDRHIVLRSGWLFGGHELSAFRRILSALESGEQIRVDSSAEGTPTPVDDVARALIAILLQLDCGAARWGVYHYSSSDRTNSRDFVEAIISMATQYDRIDLEHIHLLEDKAAEAALPGYPTLDCSKILNTFGIKQRPWRSTMTGLLRTIYQQQSEQDIATVE